MVRVRPHRDERRGYREAQNPRDGFRARPLPRRFQVKVHFGEGTKKKRGRDSTVDWLHDETPGYAPPQ